MDILATNSEVAGQTFVRRNVLLSLCCISSVVTFDETMILNESVLARRVKIDLQTDEHCGGVFIATGQPGSTLPAFKVPKS